MLWQKVYKNLLNVVIKTIKNFYKIYFKRISLYDFLIYFRKMAAEMKITDMDELKFENQIYLMEVSIFEEQE